MNQPTSTSNDPFDGGPPMRLQKSLRLVLPGQPRVVRRALLAVLISWAPLAVLTAVAALSSSGQTARSLFSDFGVHARFLVAAPALIIAEADCLPWLGDTARHFLNAGLIADKDLARYEDALASTRRLLNSPAGDLIAALVTYSVVIALMMYVKPETPQQWNYSGPGGPSHLTAAGWWHVLVSLPLLLLLFFGWLWRLALWTRFLFIMARLDLQLVPSHPDLVGGLRFVSVSLRKFRLISLAIGTVVAGSLATSVVQQGRSPLDLENFAVGLAVFVIIVFVCPLTVFVKRLRDTKKQGAFQYGALAGFLGTQFEHKWLGIANSVQATSLEQPDFSATTDLYAVVANVYEKRNVPIKLRDLIPPVASALAPLIPVALMAVPFKVLINSLLRLFV